MPPRRARLGPVIIDSLDPEANEFCVWHSVGSTGSQRGDV